VNARREFPVLDTASLSGLLWGLLDRARVNLTSADMAAFALLDESAIATVGHIASLCNGLGCMLAGDDDQAGIGAFRAPRDLSALLFAIGGMADQTRGLLELAGYAQPFAPKVAP
jgi:hypothetical protein